MILGASAVAIKAATNARARMSLTISIDSLFLNFRLIIESQRKTYPVGHCFLLSLSILDRLALIGLLSGMPREI
jgi:hypothetical protein